MINLHYEFNNIGSKTTVLFLHGWGLSGNSFNSIISRLNPINVLKVDLYGFGKSSESREYFDAYEYAYQIFLLLKELSIDEVIMVGHSFGGRLSIILSSVFGINVKNLVLTSSAGINRFNIKTWCKVRLYKLIKFLIKLKIISSKKLKNYGSRDYKNSSVIMKKILVKVVRQDLRFLLKNITTKTLLIWDKNDKDTPYYICKVLNRNIKNSQVVLYKNGGHFVAFANINKFAFDFNNFIK